MGESDPLTPISVHQALGGGSVADLLLWRRKLGAVFLLGSATTFWYLFERAGYNFLSFVATVLLFLVIILFFWAKSATLLNRPLPPLPNLELSEASAWKAADALQVWINGALSVAGEIAVDRDLRRLLQVGFVLWIVSCLGNLFNILTLIYIGIVISLTIPVIYEKYQDHIDDKLRATHRIIQTQYRRVDDSFLKKIPMPMKKEKKIE